MQGGKSVITYNLGSQFETNKVTVTDSEQDVLTPALLTNRLTVYIVNAGSKIAYIKSSSGVDTDDFPVYPRQVIQLKGTTSLSLYAICATGESTDFRIAESDAGG